MTRKDGSPAKTATFQLTLPGREAHNVGVCLLDVQTDRLYWKFAPDWQVYADEEDIEVLQLFDDTLRVAAEQMGGTRLLAHIADTWSNTLQLCDEQEVQVQDCQAEIGRLFRARVVSA